jgi:Ca2+-binding RTX toxin-like protein
VQSGADTLIQVDIDGTGAAGFALKTLLRLQNVQATQLTARNFSPSYDPENVGVTIVGTPFADSLAGTESSDAISGGFLNDTLAGLGGNDISMADKGATTLPAMRERQPNGGSEADSLYGGSGNDTIRGGDGSDFIQDDRGANVLDGGDGDDIFQYVGSSTSNSESGLDTITGGAGSDTYRIYGTDCVITRRSGTPTSSPTFKAGAHADRDIIDLSELTGYFRVGTISQIRSRPATCVPSRTVRIL